MNKVYRTVWNEHTNTWVAVQETAKARGKSSQSGGSIVSELGLGGSRFMMTAAASAVLLMSGQAMAVRGDNSSSGNSHYCVYDETSQTVICGDETTESVDTVAGKPAKSVLLGKEANNTGESNVAIGLKSQSAEAASVAIGSEAKALHNQSVAIGQNAEAHADWDISIGRRAGAETVNPAAEGRNVAIGDGALRKAVSPNNNIAMGTSAGDELTGNANVILGTYANSKTANNEIRKINEGITASNVVAIGDRALATTNSAVAIGNRVKATGAIATAVGAGADASGAYSISNGYGATSSGSHSIAIGSAQNQNFKTQATNSFAIAIGSNQTSATGNSAIAIGTEAKAAGLNSVSLGKLAGHVASDATVAQLSQTVNIGYRAGVGVKRNIHGIAIGNGAGEAVDSPSGQNIALGNAAGSRVKGNTNVAISARAGQDVEGHDNFAALVDAGQNIKGNNNIAIGKNAGRGTNAAAPLEVSNTIAMGFEAQGTHNDTIALGQKAKAQVEDSIAIGRGVTTELLAGDTAGNREGMIAIGSETTKASGKAAVAIGRNSRGIGRGTVALGDASKSLAGQGIAVGAQANVDAAAAGGVAIGSVAKSQGVLAVALGSQAEASAARSVAVGALSQATRAALTPNAATSDAATAAANQVYALVQASDADKTAISATVKGNLGAVSVGNATNTRQIMHVAAGTEDSDAVNVAQLKAVANV
ncbi:ESPR-type extended signal peptide-containing protein, partial [Neisseria shayeganii]